MNINSIGNFSYRNIRNKMPKKANVETSGSIGMINSKKTPFENPSFGYNPIIVKQYPASTIEGLTRQEKTDIDYCVENIISSISKSEKRGGGVDGEVTRAFMQGLFNRYSNNITALKYILKEGGINETKFGGESSNPKFVAIFLEEFNKADIKEPEKKEIFQELLNYEYGKKSNFYKEEDPAVINAILDCAENYSDVLYNLLTDRKYTTTYNLVSKKTNDFWEHNTKNYTHQQTDVKTYEKVQERHIGNNISCISNYAHYQTNIEPYEKIQDRLIGDIIFCIDNNQLDEEGLNTLIQNSMSILDDDLKKYSEF